MFTVKWIGEDGDEMLYGGVRDVSFTPAGRRQGTTPDASGACVSFYFSGQQSAGPGDSFCTLVGGRVFVMNEHGKTVADYILSTKEFPSGLAPRQAA